MSKRFKKINIFIQKEKRMPTNKEIITICKLRKTSLGATTHDIIHKYKQSLTHCPTCNTRLKT